MIMKGKPIDRLVNRESINLQKSTASHDNKRKGDATSRTPAIGSCNPPKKGGTVKNRPNIQDVRCEIMSSKRIYW